MSAPRPLAASPLASASQGGAFDAERLFLRLFADAEASFWLDAGADAAEGWSILGTGDIEDDPAVVRAVSLTARRPAPAGAVAEVPFRGGWIGWLSYEEGAAARGAPTAGPSAGAWIAVTRAIAVQHGTGRLLALAEPERLREWQAEVQAVLDAAAAAGDAAEEGHGADAGPAAGADPDPAAGPDIGPGAPAAGEGVVATARHGVAEYRDMVEACRAAIERGDAYQLCLTTRFSARRPADPIAVYRRLRRATPAHHGGCIRVGERLLLSASPEQFLSVTGGTASTSPIKGTRRRGTTAEEDALLAEELRADPKERAENVMIVDLMRNDLSQVGVPGTVRVERLWEVESYPAVHQLVSTVAVRLRDGVTVGDLADAAFPAGSMTGAPKLSAMTILHGLEAAPRGVYSGCFGHVGLDGEVDLAMVIRSIVVEPDEAYVGAGGGITWLSRAAAEVAEVAVKARAPLAALGAALPPEWAGAAQSR